jgi:hypothetical protein
MHTVSLVLGILALVGMLIGFIPCLGWLNWFNIPFAVVGLVIGIVATTQAPPDKRGMAIGGTVMCAVATGLGMIRLLLGGGIF